MFGRNYDKPGKGVNKRDPNQSKISLFFELLGLKWRDICKANMFYVVTALPTFLICMFFMGLFSSQITNILMIAVEEAGASTELAKEALKIDILLRAIFSFIFLIFVGQGPTTAGITYLLRSYAKEECVFFFTEWWQHTKSNFRQALLIWLFDIIIVGLLVTAFVFYASRTDILSIFAGVVALVVVIYLFMHFYIYQLMITFENKIKDIYKNSFIFAIQNIIPNALMLVISLAIHIGLPYMGIRFGWSILFWIIFILAEVIALPSLTGFMTNFYTYYQLEKYIIEQKETE